MEKARAILGWPILLALAFVELGAAAPMSPVPGDAVRGPNVVLIVADDMALGDLSALNGGLSRTPVLDQILREGVWFSRGYSASPVCAPARAALHTGRYPHRTGVVSLTMEQEPELTRLKVDETTIADVFRGRGYRTGLVGKWHNGLGHDWHPRQRGFDEFSGFTTARNSFFNFTLEIEGRPREFRDAYLTDVFSDLAIDFVRRQRDRPFFLELAHYAPHRPLHAPKAAVDEYLKRGFDEQVATVYAMVEIMDRGIGRLLETLEELGLRERTLIAFVSDNGPDSYVPTRFNGGQRGTKYQVYEGGIRVPFLLHWPGTLAPREVAEPAHFVDLLPTLAELARVPSATIRPLDGTSLVPLQRGGSIPSRPLFWQWNRGVPNYTHNAAVRLGEWKLVRPFVTGSERSPADSDRPSVLYHLGNDPLETTDLSAQHPEKARELRELLADWCEAVEADRRREAVSPASR